MRGKWYIVIENIALSNNQRNTLISDIQTWGQEDGSTDPSRRLRFKIRTDNQAALFRSAFESGYFGIYFLKVHLGTVFNVDPSTIDCFESTVSYSGGGRNSTVFVFSRLGIDYLRVIIFGTLGVPGAAKQECNAYTDLDRVGWP